jgi:hypothetical protein
MIESLELNTKSKDEDYNILNLGENYITIIFCRDRVMPYSYKKK